MVRLLVVTLAVLLALPAVVLATAGSRELRVDADGLSVDLDDAPLEWVLDTLGTALDVQVVVDGRLDGTVSARFTALPPARAIRRLAGSRPLLMRWTADGELSSIRVRGEPATVVLAVNAPGAEVQTDKAPDPAPTLLPDPATELDAPSLRMLDRRLAQRVRGLQTDWRREASATADAELAEEAAPYDLGVSRDEIRALSRQGDGVAIERLGEFLETEADPALRQLAIRALAGIDSPFARELVGAALE